MPEKVETGGLMRFDYSRTEEKKLSNARREAIEKGYDEYYERKEREKKRKFFLYFLIFILILAGILAWIFLR